jgi:hydrogenase expression/formation protein HypE
MLGLDPLYVANEGTLVAFAPAEGSAQLLEAMHSHDLGREACDVGEVVVDHPGRVLLRTPIGGTRILDTPLGEQLPRIC